MSLISSRFEHDDVLNCAGSRRECVLSWPYSQVCNIAKGTRLTNEFNSSTYLIDPVRVNLEIVQMKDSVNYSLNMQVLPS